MESQPSPNTPTPVTNGSSLPATSEWPTVPPAPAPVKPASSFVTPEPPLLRSTAAPVSSPYPAAMMLDDDEPTMMIPTGLAPTTAPPSPQPAARDQGALAHFQRSLLRRRDQGGRGDTVWQPTFAYVSGLVILSALILVTLPLWIVLYRISGPASNNGAGPQVADLVALCMMLMGGFLAAAAAWVIMLEMRARVRLVDTLATTGERRAGERDTVFAANPPLEGATEPIHAPRAEPVTLTSFSALLKSFGQLPAQVAMLAVALALFVGATVLSLQ